MLRSVPMLRTRLLSGSARMLLGNPAPEHIVAPEHGEPTTGLTGLAVDVEARAKLRAVYASTLEVLGAMPADALYRAQTEALVRSRDAVLASAKDDAAVVAEIASGHGIEEVLQEGKDELALAGRMLECVSRAGGEGWGPAASSEREEVRPR